MSSHRDSWELSPLALNAWSLLEVSTVNHNNQHKTNKIHIYILISVWNLNLSGVGYNIDFISSPFADENPVFTTIAIVSSSFVFIHFIAVVPENKKCLI